MSVTEAAFLRVLNMSITASYVAVAVILVRSLLRKSPKVFAYALWSVVLFRLICPLSIPLTFSMLGLMNASVPGSGPAQYTPEIGHIAPQPQPVINSGLILVDNAINRSLPVATPAASVDPMQIFLSVISLIWVLGIAVILAYSILSYIRMQGTLATATRVRDNIFETDQISTAFVCGFTKPRIYVPVGLAEAELSHILDHERTHIRRGDHLVKPLAFVALALHWFNPLMWVSFVLMSRDMEMSCDEAVLARVGHQEKIRYSGSLLSLSTRNRGLIAASPLAFSESNVKDRIKNVLNYKKPRFWMTLVAAITVVASVVVLAGNPKAGFDIDKLQEAAKQFSTSESDLAKIGEAGVLNYYASFMDKGVPKEYRITSYEIKELAVLAGDEREFAVGVTADYSTTSLYFMSANGEFRPVGDGYECTGDYKEFRIKKVGENTYRIISIGTGGGAGGLPPVGAQEVAGFVEDQLSIIMSAPPGASNPHIYIQLHSEEYEKIIKYGGEKALGYLLLQFETGNVEGLRGQVIMQLCKDLLGLRNNVTDDTLAPKDWYKALAIRQEIDLPDFVYTGEDPLSSYYDIVRHLVYSTEMAIHSQPHRGFTVIAPKIHGQYEDGDFLKVFVTTFSAAYRLYEDTVDRTTASVVPSAITYKKHSEGNYVLHEYKQAMDGSEFAKSIRDFSQINGREIPGLADQVLHHYGNYSDIVALQHHNLRQHLIRHGITKATYTNARGEVVMSIP